MPVLLEELGVHAALIVFVVPLLKIHLKAVPLQLKVVHAILRVGRAHRHVLKMRIVSCLWGLKQTLLPVISKTLSFVLGAVRMRRWKKLEPIIRVSG
jgi:hypothetical protein